MRRVLLRLSPPAHLCCSSLVATRHHLLTWRPRAAARRSPPPTRPDVPVLHLAGLQHLRPGHQTRPHLADATTYRRDAPVRHLTGRHQQPSFATDWLVYPIPLIPDDQIIFAISFALFWFTNSLMQAQQWWWRWLEWKFDNTSIT
jgi:hypothetical protein